MEFNSSIAYPDTFDITVSKSKAFTELNKDALITFIIPTINRDTLSRALSSILQQTLSNWKAIIIFDGCQPTDESLLSLLNDSRFLYIPIKRTGSQQNSTHGQAGFVRNIGMKLVNTPWIGFIDDDDVIIPTYLQHLEEEIQITPHADVISFKMIYNNDIFPPINYSSITQNTIGISFTIKTSLLKEGFAFKQSTSEDFMLLHDLQEANKTIVLSPYITYCVRNSALTNNIMSNRFVINSK